MVLDNTVENTCSVDDQMSYLAWKLELAIRSMGEGVDKYTIFMVLTIHSYIRVSYHIYICVYVCVTDVQLLIYSIYIYILYTYNIPIYI